MNSFSISQKKSVSICGVNIQILDGVNLLILDVTEAKHKLFILETNEFMDSVHVYEACMNKNIIKLKGKKP